MSKTLKQHAFHSPAGDDTFAEIIDRLRCFSIDDATPVETLLFLMELQHDIAAKDRTIEESETSGSMYY